MLNPTRPSLVLAPMDGITDAPMRAYQGESGAFGYSVSEFLRVSMTPIPRKVFIRDVPEVANGCLTSTGLPVQVQILGGDPDLMATSAYNAWRAGANAIDINFGCPAPTVNRNDGGATLLQYPERILEVVKAVRGAVPIEVPVSAKLRLGWDSISQIHHNAEMAAKGGASWITIHARTKIQGYAPPVFWEPIGEVRRALGLPIIANGDIWSLDDYRRCRDITGCIHFMIGRGAMADPQLPYRIGSEMGVELRQPMPQLAGAADWVAILNGFMAYCDEFGMGAPTRKLRRLKQWLSMAHRHGSFDRFDVAKHATTLDELMDSLMDLSDIPSLAN